MGEFVGSLAHSHAHELLEYLQIKGQREASPKGPNRREEWGRHSRRDVLCTIIIVNTIAITN